MNALFLKQSFISYMSYYKEYSVCVWVTIIRVLKYIFGTRLKVVLKWFNEIIFTEISTMGEIDQYNSKPLEIERI